VGEQKKLLYDKSRAKRREIARFRRVLADAEAKDFLFQDNIAELEGRLSRILKRKIVKNKLY
jgi:hypothetical protein